MRLAHGLRRTLSCLIAIGALAPAAAFGSLTQATVNLYDPGPSLANAGPDTVLAGNQIAYGDSSNIGNASTGVLLSDEYIAVNPLSLVYHVFGGGTPSCPVALYSCTGYDAGAHYTFSGIQFSTPGQFIQSVTLKLTDAVYASGSGVSFTSNSVTMDVGGNALGVLDSSTDLGTVEVDLTLGNPTPVPLPPAGPLLAVGVLLLGLAGKRRMPAHVRA